MTIRKFKFGDTELPDPDPSMHADDVRKLYASQYPALLNAVIHQPETNDYEFLEKGRSGSGKGGDKVVTTEFKSSVGRKG